MRPYFEQDGITIYHGDCRDILPSLEKIDLVLSDPPYGIDLQGHRQLFPGVSVVGDTSQDLGRDVLDMCFRNGWPVIAFASPKLPWPGSWSHYLVWDKGPAVGGGGDRATCWKLSWELIQVGGIKKLNGERDEGVLRFHAHPTRMGLHPCQKPLNLLGYLIEKATHPTETILDPFMGSGSTVVAAKELGRKAIGIEVEEKYCEVAVRRLRQAVIPLGAYR